MRVYVKPASHARAIENVIDAELRLIQWYPKWADEVLDKEAVGECVIVVARPTDHVRDIITALFNARRGQAEKVGA